MIRVLRATVAAFIVAALLASCESAEPGKPGKQAATSTAPTASAFTRELAALLAGPADGPSVDAFSEEFRAEKIEFDGYVEQVYNEDYFTVDAVVRAGNPGKPATGPRFSMGTVTNGRNPSAEELLYRSLKKGQLVHVAGLLGMYKTDGTLATPVVFIAEASVELR